jgi:hypothetical protein
VDLDHGSAVTNTLVTGAGQLYAATSGWVFRLDRGNAVAHNDLPGLGACEVRLAAPADSSQLVVGTNGVARGLHPISLAQLWECGCPGAGNELVNPLCLGGRTYAATNGYVFRIDPANGRVLASNGLSGRGNHETRICGALSGSKLVVGIHGWVLLLDANTLATIWQKPLVGCNPGVTAVSAWGGLAHGACNGHVYLLDLATGAVPRHNGLPDLGDHYVSLAAPRSGNLLYVGIHGWGVALNPLTLAEVYRVCLPGSGYSDVEAIAGDGCGWFANGGRLFQIADGGAHEATPIDERALPQMEGPPTRIAASFDRGAGQLVLGMNGRATALAFRTDLGVQDHPWMGDHRGILGPKKLREVALPGSHHAAMYSVGPNSTLAADELGTKYATASVPAAGILPWAMRQQLDFGQQLAAGIRYFDLRTQFYNGDFVFVNGLVGPSVSTLLEQLSAFLRDPKFEHEVLILDFNRFYAMGPAEHGRLAARLQGTLGDKLVPRTLGRDATLDAIWRTPGRVLVFYNDAPTCDTRDCLWRASDIAAPEALLGTAEPQGLVTFLDMRAIGRYGTFAVLQAVLTPTWQMIAASIGHVPVGIEPGGLKPAIVNWIDGLRARRRYIPPPNVVTCDFSDRFDFISRVVQLNDVDWA